MAMNELFKMTAHQVKEGNFNKAILAIGSCEAHGQHIAEGCDTLVSYKLSKQIADQVEGMLGTASDHCRLQRTLRFLSFHTDFEL